jgi:predicted nucleic acid-binding protein
LSRFCLDTSAYSHFRRGEPAVVEHFDRAEWLGLPAVVLGELWTGFLGGKHRDRNAKELATFLDHPVVELLVVDAEVSRIYAEIVVDLRQRGTPLPTNDLWIAAVAARFGAPVLTFDRHFEQIARVGTVVLDRPELETFSS